MLSPFFVDHLVFRVAELRRTEQFYTALLGRPGSMDHRSIMYLASTTRIFFTTADDPPEAPYDKERVGLNHLAFGVRTLDELQAVAAELTSRKFRHSGVVMDTYGLSEFLWLDDPDGMRVKFYLRAE